MLFHVGLGFSHAWSLAGIQCTALHASEVDAGLEQAELWLMNCSWAVPL